MVKMIATAAVTALFVGVTWAQLDLNKATEVQLDGLKGLGPAMTRQVMDERQKAPFRDWPDVMQRIKGIGPKKAISLSEQGVQVQGQAYGQASIASQNKP
jgi:competence protein ComEA